MIILQKVISYTPDLQCIYIYIYILYLAKNNLIGFTIVVATVYERYITEFRSG